MGFAICVEEKREKKSIISNLFVYKYCGFIYRSVLIPQPISIKHSLLMYHRNNTLIITSFFLLFKLSLISLHPVVRKIWSDDWVMSQSKNTVLHRQTMVQTQSHWFHFISDQNILLQYDAALFWVWNFSHTFALRSGRFSFTEYS